MFAKKRITIILLCACAMVMVYFTFPANAADPLPLVKVISTGGTIADIYDEATGLTVAALSGKDLVKAVPGINKIARIEVEDVVNIGSSSITPDLHWAKISKQANEFLANPEVTGVVITHGTDTLEEAAYFMDLTITSQKPVILVGAMRASSMRDSDGPRNLLNAIRVAISPEAMGKGAMIVMNGQINAARDVSKTSSIEAETFKSLEFGQLGVADVQKVRFYRAPLRRQTITLDPGAKLGRVEIVFHYAGNDGHVIRALLSQGLLEGLVIAGTGVGHVGNVAFVAVKEARNKGIPVVISTRALTGRAMPIYSSNIPLKDIGCVFADNLNPWKARLLLMLALTKTKKPEELQKYFDY